MTSGRKVVVMGGRVNVPRVEGCQEGKMQEGC